MRRLTSRLQVQALIRLCQVQGGFAAVRHSGEAERGAILVKLNRFGQGCRLYERRTDLDGQEQWQPVGESQSEADADATIAQRRKVDRDLWVVEVEDAGALVTALEGAAPDRPPL